MFRNRKFVATFDVCGSERKDDILQDSGSVGYLDTFLLTSILDMRTCNLVGRYHTRDV